MDNIIKSIDPGSPAAGSRLAPGDLIEEINGHPVTDILDYKFYTYDARLRLLVEAQDGTRRTVRVRKGEGADERHGRSVPEQKSTERTGK